MFLGSNPVCDFIETDCASLTSEYSCYSADQLANCKVPRDYLLLKAEHLRER